MADVIAFSPSGHIVAVVVVGSAGMLPPAGVQMFQSILSAGKVSDCGIASSGAVNQIIAIIGCKSCPDSWSAKCSAARGPVSIDVLLSAGTSLTLLGGPRIVPGHAGTLLAVEYAEMVCTCDTADTANHRITFPLIC